MGYRSSRKMWDKRVFTMNYKNIQHNIEDKFDIGGYAFLAFLIYLIYIWITDFLSFIIYILRLPKYSYINEILAFIFIIAFLFLFRKKVEIKKQEKDIFVLISIVSIFALGIFKSILPDISYDTANYHLINQYPNFLDNLHYNVAPGRLQNWIFKLPDRLFYYFRLALGYRMGTILNLIVCIIVYLQIINILVLLCGTKLQMIRNSCKSIFKQSIIPGFLFKEGFIALIIVLVYDVVLQFGTYLIDIITLPTLIEMFRIIVKNKPSKNKFQIPYFAILCGFSFALKMTNIIFIFPLLVVFIYQNRKSLKISSIIINSGLVVLPVIIYLVYNLLSTGNPVFPFYNKIFQSPYFPNQNFKDARWGPTTFLEILLWPIFLAFKPEYRQSEIPNPWPYGFTGVIISFIYLFILQIKTGIKKNETRIIILITFITSFFLWEITTGHIRYNIFGMIIGGIIFTIFMSEVIAQRKKIAATVSIILFLVLCIQPIIYVYKDIIGKEWSWRSLDLSFYADNSKLLFKDKQFANESQSKHIDGFIINGSITGSFAYCINQEVPIINNAYIHQFISNDELKKNYQKRIENMLTSGLNVYDLIIPVSTNLSKYVQSLDEYGIKLDSIEWLDGHFLNKNNMLLLKLGKLGVGETNRLYFANDPEINSILIKKEQDKVTFKASIGYNVDLGWLKKRTFHFSVIANDGNMEKNVMTIPIEESSTYEINQEIDLSGLSEEVLLKFELYDSNYKKVENIGPYKLMIINPEIK